MRTVSLILVLCAFWLASSGRTGPMPLGLMTASVALVAALAHRLRLLDAEGHPTHLLPRAPGYWAWLAGRVALSNLTVARIIFSPRAELDARLLRVPLTQRDDLGRTVFANSVTLTPGSATVEVHERELVVHCLTAAIAADLGSGEFDRRVTAFTGGRE